jgi:hypothetical protein
MKKIIVILLTFLYLIPAIGFSIDVHWCGSKIQAVSIQTSHKKQCPCRMEMPKGCCKDLHQVIKLTDNQCLASTLSVPNNNFIIHFTNVSHLPLKLSFTQVKIFDFSNYHAPPGASELPLYLSNRILRI